MRPDKLFEIVWETVLRDVPELHRQVAQILADEYP
jgi:uncharacterized protein with HEPN domain